MDAGQSRTPVDKKVCDGNDDKQEILDSPTTASKPPESSTAAPSGPLTQDTSFSEQISTEDTELSSADTSVNVFQNKTTDADARVDIHLHSNPNGGVTRSVSFCGSCSVEKAQPKPLCVLSPSSTEACTLYEVSQSITSVSRSQDSLKTTTVYIEPDGDDFCAAILMACLFCHPLDCLLATVQGCNQCAWSLCRSLCSFWCGCEPSSTLQPLLDSTRQCGLCGCLDVCGFPCDCPVCDLCLQATECLDLCMEISQMLYH